MIRTSHLTYAYPGQAEMSFPDIACQPNEHALILGKSGKGKTTLLHLLGGLLTPANGEIVINDTAVHKLRGKQLDAFRGKHIGIIFQKSHFIKSLTAIENLLLTQSLSHNEPDHKLALQLIQRLGIGHKANQKTFSLSLGEQQRLAIARALINKPAIILADEPSSALDDENCTKMIELLQQVAHEQKSNLIIVTHDSRIKNMFDKKIELNEILAADN